MNSRSSYILICLIFLVSCKNLEEQKVTEAANVIADTSKSITNVTEAEALLIALDGPKLKVVDFRKQEDYRKGHIPNAVSMYRSDIEDGTYPYKGMMASKTAIETLFSKLGIKNGDTLVVYDDRGGTDAARLWWVLQNYDYPTVKLLNGGFDAWIAAKGPVTSTETLVEPSNFILPKAGSMRYLIKLEELQNMLSRKTKPLILDVRTADEYSGKRQKSGAARAGRIPDSELIDWSKAIDYYGTHKFRPYEELEALYGTLGVSKNDTIITYCHTGVRSAHTTFVLSQLLGYANVKNYDGSWSEWSYHVDLPIERDSKTLIKQ